MTESTTIRWEQDRTGLVTLVLDDPNQSANTMNQAFRESLAVITDRLEAKKVFLALVTTTPVTDPASSASSSYSRSTAARIESR